MGSSGEGLAKLGSLGGGETYAAAINNAGQVVGWSNTTSGQTHAFITGPNGLVMTDLGTLGGDKSGATGINDAGQVVGSSVSAFCCADRAFITGPNGVGMTGFLPTAGAGDAYSAATGINDAAQVVGYTYSTERHILITGPNGVGRLDAGRLGGIAKAINNDGQVVGN
jgi:probable HAF family extracellular repeat protein